MGAHDISLLSSSPCFAGAARGIVRPAGIAFEKLVRDWLCCSCRCAVVEHCLSYSVSESVDLLAYLDAARVLAPPPAVRDDDDLVVDASHP